MVMDVNEASHRIHFKFPFTPYKIQEDFMTTLYTALDCGKIGIFESPTGTGKSLSLICGALKWLEDYELQRQEEMKKLLEGSAKSDKDLDAKNGNDVDWIEEYVQNKAIEAKIESAKEYEEKRRNRKEKILSIRRARETGRKVDNAVGMKDMDLAGQETRNSSSVPVSEDDSDLVLAEYHSDGENPIKEDDEEDPSNREDELKQEEEHCMKIFYCSRTHSQLSQFIHEVQKSPYSDSVKMVALGSRQSYCINDEVRKLKHLHMINERCLELQKLPKVRNHEDDDESRRRSKRQRKSAGCPFYGLQKSLSFGDQALVEVQDIEQMVVLGRELEACPYYGSRRAIPQAQLVVLPYNMLLHKSTRDAVGIKLKGNVIIVDEAHNLIETINNMYSVEVNGSQVATSFAQLTQYMERYRNRLKAKNLMYIGQLLQILSSLLDLMEGKGKHDDKENKIHAPSENDLLTLNDFTFKAKIDNLNLFKIRRYCEQSCIARKLNGFVDKYSKGVAIGLDGSSQEGNATSQFIYMEAFLDCLTNYNADGRVLLSKSERRSQSSIKYLLLNPAVYFTEVILECKSVIIAGGTMQPVSEFKDVLFRSAGIHQDRIVEFSCGHVIPDENLTAVVIGSGPSSVELDFTYTSRDRVEVIDELGRAVKNICTVVPGGAICFFPSYDYEEKVFKRWWSTGLIQKIETRKKLFREPRKGGSVDELLSEYARTIKRSMDSTSQQCGALLFSIVGGKVSEGINFSDDLGRCIIMVGLPYPNVNSPELKEKMDFLNKTIGPTAGQEHYENLCMKAVNQSIGRAIRHKKDYACIVLADHRYGRPSIQKKLPQWIQRRVQVHSRFGPAFSSVSQFFAGKRKLEGSSDSS